MDGNHCLEHDIPMPCVHCCEDTVSRLLAENKSLKEDILKRDLLLVHLGHFARISEMINRKAIDALVEINHAPENAHITAPAILDELRDDDNAKGFL